MAPIRGLHEKATEGKVGVGGDAIQHALVAGSDVVLHCLERGGGAVGHLWGEFGAELAQGVELPHQLAPQGQQVPEQLEVGLLRGGRGEAVQEAETGQHDGIDAVILGLLSKGLGEASRAQWIDQHGCQASRAEALVQVPVVAAGGFEDSARDAVLQQPVAQGAAAALVIGEVALPAACEDMGVESGLADINPGHYDGGGWCHS